jgi:hypothetical protein
MGAQDGRRAGFSPRNKCPGTAFPLVTEALLIGHRVWAIPEGYIPSRSFSEARDLISHEAACTLNATDATASIEITLYFENREPARPYRLTLEPRRTRHLRFNDLSDPEPVPRDTPYSSVIRSDVEIVVQRTRLDSRDSNIALLSTIAFPGNP